MGANDAKEMLEVAKQECVRLERENADLRETIRLGTEQLEAVRSRGVSLPDRTAVFEAIANRLGEHEKAYNEFDPSDEPVTCITLKGVPVETLAEFIAPAVLTALSTQPAAGNGKPQRLDPELRADLIEFARARIESVWADVPGGVDAATLAGNVVAAQEFCWMSRQIPVSVQPAAGEVEWEQAKWHELKADDQETGAPEGDTIRLAWENGTVLVGRLTVPSVGAGHQQMCRMQTVFGGDTFVFPHGSTLTRKVREAQPEAPPTELDALFPGTLAALDNLNIRPEVQ